MKKLLLALALLFAPSVAWGQCNGVFSANTLCGSVLGGPPGQVSLTNSNFVFSGVISQPATGFFFSQNGAKINRMNDRLFIGGATPNDGAFPLTNKDWLSAYAASVPGLGNYMCCTVGAILTLPTSAAGAASSAQAMLEGAQSAPFTSSSTAGIANTAIAINNNTTLATNVWAYYGECHNVTSPAVGCLTMELDPTNHNTNPPGQPDPFQQGTVIGFQDACGAGLSSNIYACHAAIQIVPNAQSFQTGINFLTGSITSNSAAGSTTAAISLPPNYHVLWDIARGVFGGSITVNTLSQFVLQSAGGIQWLNSAGGTRIFDCYVSTAFQCTFGTQLNLTNSANLALVGGAAFIANPGNTDSYSFNDAGSTLVFQHNGGQIFSVNSIGTITTSGGMGVTGGNSYVAFNGGGMIWENGGNSDAFSAGYVGSTGLIFQHAFSGSQFVLLPSGGIAIGTTTDPGNGNLLLTGSVQASNQVIGKRIVGSGSTPTASSCTGFTLGTGSNDVDGKVTFNAATTCAISFGTAFSNPPFCTVTPGSGASTLVVSASTTLMSASFGTSQTAMHYHCLGS